MLIGSGVSVAAGIPTGWKVVLDLISKVARVLGEDPGDDASGWYEGRFGEEPDYSNLIDKPHPERAKASLPSGLVLTRTPSRRSTLAFALHSI